MGKSLREEMQGGVLWKGGGVNGRGEPGEGTSSPEEEEVRWEGVAASLRQRADRRVGPVLQH